MCLFALGVRDSVEWGDEVRTLSVPSRSPLLTARPVSFAAVWTAGGVTMPVRDVVVDLGVVHVDADGVGSLVGIAGPLDDEEVGGVLTWDGGDVWDALAWPFALG